MNGITTNWQDNGLPLAVGLLGAAVAASLVYSPVPFLIVLLVPAAVYFLSRPYELLLVMVFLIPFNFVFRVGPIPVAAELLKVFAWIPFLLCRAGGSAPFKKSRSGKWFLVLAGIIFFSLVRSQDLPFTLKESVRLASNIGLCYLVVNLVDSRQKVLQVLRVLAASALLVACYGFYQFYIQDYGALFWIVNPRMDTDFSHGRFAFWPWRDRITSVLTSEMELGHYFNLCIPVAFVLWITEGRKRAGSKWLAITVALLAGLILTFTFGAWVSLAATAAWLILLFDSKRRMRMILIFALIVLLVGALVAVGPLRPLVEGKLLGNGVGSFAWDAFTRLDSWLFALDTWRAHPFFGVGIGNYEILELSHEWIHSEWGPSGSSPHETYLYILVQSGLVGLVSILAILLSTIRNNLRVKLDPELGLVALGLVFALTTNLLGGFSDDSSFFGPHTSYLVWLLMGMSETVFNLVGAGDRFAIAHGIGS